MIQRPIRSVGLVAPRLNRLELSHKVEGDSKERRQSQVDGLEHARLPEEVWHDEDSNSSGRL